MIAFLFLEKLTFYQIIIYEIIQSLVDFLLIFCLISLILKLFTRKTDFNFSFKKNLYICFYIELISIIFGFGSLIFIYLGASGLLTGMGACLIAESIVIYLAYYKKDEMSEIKILLIFIISIIPSLILSIYFTNFIFNLFGINKPLTLKLI